jgi:signal transduction histidine kinase
MTTEQPPHVMGSRLSLPASLGLAAAAVAVAALLTLALLPWLPHTQLLLFYAAVMLGVAVGGLRVGIFAIVLSLLAGEFIIIGGFGMPEPSLYLLLRQVLFVGVSLGAAVLVDRLQRARAAAESSTLEAQRLADQLAEQATELELQVADSEALAEELQDANRGLEHGAARAERLQRLTMTLLRTVGEAPVRRVIARELRRAAEAGAAAVAVLDDDGACQVRAVDVAYDFTIDRDDVRPVLADVAHAGEPLWCASAAGFAERYPAAAGVIRPAGAVAVLPLSGERGVAGALLLAFAGPRTFAPDERTFMMLAAGECAQALERARLHGMSMNALVRAGFAERRLAFLADTSARLAESLDYRAALRSVARQVVPELADWCLVHVHDDAGVLQLVEVVHTDPAREDACRSLELRRPGISALRDLTGAGAWPEPVLLASIEEADLQAAAADDEQLRHLQSLEVRSQLIAPVCPGGECCGTITLITSAPAGRSFGAADATLAAELARRAGYAIANARLYQAAQHASDAKSNFLAVISHELRTPLNAIIGYTDLMLLGIPSELPAQLHRQVERIRLASDGLLQLVEEVLSFSRIEAGGEVLRLSPVDLSALLHAAVALVAPQAASKSLDVDLELPAEPIMLISDEHKIRQVVTNLLSNAVKFTDDGSVRIRVERAGDIARVQVCDTGVGIAAEHLERIFEPFWQVEHPSTRRFGGTGLGLGVARKIVHLLEGQLHVQSAVGEGSVFTLELPLRAGMPSPEP